jgi:DNA-binding NtrC family response regulator
MIGMAAQNSSISQNQLKILIIDDEKELRLSLKKILERSGFFVETAQDLASAHKIMGNYTFDILLVDIILIKTTGIEVVRKLQEEFQYFGIIIFITGEPNLETAIQAIKIGAFDYIEKPLTKDVLLSSVNTAINRYQNQIRMTISQQINSKKITSPKIPQNPLKLDIRPEIKPLIENIYNALVDLKKKFGDSFNEEQKDGLNVIAKNVLKARDLLADK